MTGEWVKMVAGPKTNTARKQQQRDEPRTLQRLLRIVRGDWLGEDIASEARRFLPSLLLGVYQAEQQGRRVSKRDGCRLMGADPTSSGPKYIKLAEELGWIVVERKAREDKRKDFLRATARLTELLDSEIAAITGGYAQGGSSTADEVQFVGTAETNVIEITEYLRTGRKRSAPERDTEESAPARDREEVATGGGRPQGNAGVWPAPAHAEGVGLVARERAERAAEYWDAGLREKAIAEIDEAIRLANEEDVPFFDGYLARRALMLAGCGRYEEAIIGAEGVLACVGFHPDALFARAQANKGLGRLKAAIKDYTELLRVHPHLAIVFHCRGVAREELGELDLAVKDYVEASRQSTLRSVPDYQGAAERLKRRMPGDGRAK